MKHLNETDRHALTRQLERMRSQVLDELCGTAPDIPTAGDAHEVRSHADEAETARQDDVRFAEAEVDRVRLREIEQAMNRLAEGRYGVCMACGEDIPRERLLAQPTAIRCAACQAAAERGNGR